MTHENLKQRTKQFAVRVVRFVETLPKTGTAQTIGRQLLRSGTSTGANYRAASRAKSKADFIAKMGIVEEETDESMFWLELLVEAGVTTPSQIFELHKEAGEIVAITVSSINTARGHAR